MKPLLLGLGPSYTHLYTGYFGYSSPQLLAPATGSLSETISLRGKRIKLVHREDPIAVRDSLLSAGRTLRITVQYKANGVRVLTRSTTTHIKPLGTQGLNSGNKVTTADGEGAVRL
jgi:hypothetical protein